MNQDKYIKSNDMLSKLSNSDLLDLIVIINNYYLTLRDKLNFDSNVTFGIEIEVECMEPFKREDFDKISKNTNMKWDIKNDGSLIRGKEFASPIFKDSKESYIEIKKLLDVINDKSTISDRCGGHIHIGTQVLGDNFDSWTKLLKIWVTYENVFFRYSAGEFLNNRNNIIKYANSLKAHEKYISSIEMKTLNELIENVKHMGRHCAINFSNVNSYLLNGIMEYNTIEFRTPNGSLNPVIWQNNINTFVHLLLSSKSDKIDMNIVDERYKINSNIDDNIDLYNEIYLQEALELCDLIFDTNLDKFYFLRQYLKDFDFARDNVESLVLAKKFTK